MQNEKLRMTLVELKQSTVSDMGNKRKCEDSDLYPASKCKRKKNKESNIQQNIVSKKFYLCRICNYQFATIEELSSHLFLEDDSTKKFFSCVNEFAMPME